MEVLLAAEQDVRTRPVGDRNVWMSHTTPVLRRNALKNARNEGCKVKLYVAFTEAANPFSVSISFAA